MGLAGRSELLQKGTASSIAQGCLLLAHMCSRTMGECFPKTDNPSSHSLCLRRRQEGISTWDNRAAAQPSCSHGPGETGCTPQSPGHVLGLPHLEPAGLASSLPSAPQKPHPAKRRTACDKVCSQPLVSSKVRAAALLLLQGPSTNPVLREGCQGSGSSGEHCCASVASTGTVLCAEGRPGAWTPDGHWRMSVCLSVCPTLWAKAPAPPTADTVERESRAGEQEQVREETHEL